MTGADYPLLTLGGYETYQLAHIATFIADALARHRLSRRGLSGRAERASAVRDLTLGRTALDAVRGSAEPTPNQLLPRAIDAATYESALQRIGTGSRSADIVAMPDADRPTLAVVGTVPGIGRVGAVVDSADLAHGLRSHFLSRPIEELASWAVIARAEKIPALPERVDLARAIEYLDPREPAHRIVAEALRGPDPYINAAVKRQFPEASSIGQPDIGPSSQADGQQRPDHEGRPVRDQGPSIAHPDADRGEHQEKEYGQQPGRQRVVPSEHERDSREQLDVSPPQGTSGDQGENHRDGSDDGGGDERIGAVGRGEHGDQRRGSAQRSGEAIRKPSLTGIHHGSGRPRDRQRQSGRSRPQPLRHRQTRQPGQGRDGGHLGPAGTP